MNFFVVYTKNRKKFDKYIKTNTISKKYIIDVKKIISEENIDFEEHKNYLKLLILNKLERSIQKNYDFYLLPSFDGNDFNLEKLLNLKIILEENNFNILLFHDDFTVSTKDKRLLKEVMSNLDIFDNTQIIKDY